MSLKGKAYIVGAYEHPTRKAPDKSLAQLHAEVAKGALDDAGLSKGDVDGYFCASGDTPGLGGLSMVEYMGLRAPPHRRDRYRRLLLQRARRSCAGGDRSGALQRRARDARGQAPLGRHATGTAPRMGNVQQPDVQFEFPYGPATANMYAMAARRHMHQFGTTSEQLAWVKVAASHHAQHNPHAMLPKVVTVEEVVNSPMVADPLHRLDCCVISDGGGALVITKPEIAKSLKRPKVKIIGVGEANKIQGGGVGLDLTYSGGRDSGKAAFEMAGVRPSDVKYVSIYDSFTITVVIQIEDLGFCEKGEGGKFVADGNLISGVGRLPFNTDGGGLCSNHPGNRGGMTKVIEAVRQARGEAHPKVQVKNHDIVLAHGTGGSLATRHVGSTVILERE